MKKSLLLLTLCLFVVACESRADKIKRLCSLRYASKIYSQEKTNYGKAIAKISGDENKQLDTLEFCKPYLGK